MEDEKKLLTEEIKENEKNKSDKNDQKETTHEPTESVSSKITPIKKIKRSESLTSFFDPIDLPSFYIVRPASRIIPQQTEPGGPMVVQPNEPIMAKFPQDPIIIRDKKSKKVFGIRCTCEDGHTNGTLVRCTICGFFCHGQCVGVARVTPEIEHKFVCPYCQNHGLRCPCGRNMKYDEPIIRCNICGYYSHKSCSKLLFGRNPSKFICFYCGGLTTPYPQPFFSFPRHSTVHDFSKTVDDNRDEIISRLPEGDFKQTIANLLIKSELSYKETVQYLFNTFGTNCFDDRHEFWKSFVSTISMIFDVEKLNVMNAIDELVTNFMYKKRSKLKLRPISGLSISDSILSNVMSEQLYKIPQMPSAAQLSFNQWGSVSAGEDLSDGQFICSIPGLLCHQDEIRAENGIPLTCITIPATPDCIDVSQSTNKYVPFIRRSFHYNCVVKIQSVAGAPTVMMYAARARGPLGSERSTSGPAIAKGSELFLPYDSDFPYPIEKKPWKIKKVKPPPKPKAKPKPKPKPKEKKEKIIADKEMIASPEDVSLDENSSKPSSSNNGTGTSHNTSNSRSRSKYHQQQTTKPMKTRTNFEQNVELTLLSSFIEEGLSPFPFILRNEVDNDTGVKSIARTRHQSHILRNDSDQE